MDGLMRQGMGWALIRPVGLEWTLSHPLAMDLAMVRREAWAERGMPEQPAVEVAGVGGMPRVLGRSVHLMAGPRRAAGPLLLSAEAAVSLSNQAVAASRGVGRVVTATRMVDGVKAASSMTKKVEACTCLMHSVEACSCMIQRAEARAMVL